MASFYSVLATTLWRDHGGQSRGALNLQPYQVRGHLWRGTLTLPEVVPPKYKRAKGDLEPTLRTPLASPLAEIEMMNLIAFKDASHCQLYELKATSTPPTTLTEAVTIIQGILRSRVRAEELDQVNSGASVRAAPGAGPRRQGRDQAGPHGPALLALIAQLAPADPNKPITGKTKKGGKDKDKDNDKKVNAPQHPTRMARTKVSKVLRWVEGMGAR